MTTLDITRNVFIKLPVAKCKCNKEWNMRIPIGVKIMKFHNRNLQASRPPLLQAARNNMRYQGRARR